MNLLHMCEGPLRGDPNAEPRGRGGPRLAGPIHLLAPPALGEGPHCGLARRCIAMCWHAIFVLPEGQGPHPRRSHRRRMYLEDAADDSADGDHVEIVVVPIAAWATS